MPSLTFEESTNGKDNEPLAIIKDGKHQLKIVYIDDSNKAAQLPSELVNFEFNKYFPNHKARDRLIKLNAIQQSLAKNIPPADDELASVYHEIKNSISQEITVHDGNVMVCPNPDKRDTIYIFGISGAGKSTWISFYGAQFNKLFPKAHIYIFSRKASDEKLDHLKNVKRVKIDDSLVEDPIDTREDIPRGSLLIFDDCDTIQDKKQCQAVYDLMNDALQTGRDMNLYVLVVSHLASDYKKTRIIISECQGVVCFPRGSSHDQLEYMLRKKIGISKGGMEKIMNLPSRWVYIRKTYPQAVVYESGCYLAK